MNDNTTYNTFYLAFKDVHPSWSLIGCALTYGIVTIFGIIFNSSVIGLPSADQINYRTFRALFCIIVVNVGGYCITLIYLNLIKPSIASPITAWFGQVISGISLNIGAASNAPILYFTSTEYRHAFQTVFPFVFKRFSNANQVIPLHNGHPLGTTQG
ncbi:hypothetical protein niasHT_038570 [Heterodera trifolii]|uniref:Uncharacterized protein n=1 Tax=Heterodera trifolii TaxID=157864 RepID=A0ABD2HZT2_9BILA